MPIAFPNSPTQGQTTVTGGRTWTYNGSGWTTGATGSATVTVSNTLPTTTTVGSLWLNSDTGQMSAYFGGEWADFISGGAGGGGITDLPVTFYYANTEPISANIGDRWIDSETLVQFTYVNDGTSTQWVETTTRSSTGANRSLSNLTANTAINQHLIPAANVTYDLGTSSLRWRDLYLSGNTIDLGGTAIKTTANGVTFSSAANAAAMMPIMVHSLQLGTGNTAVTLHSAGGQLQTVTSTGTTAPVFDGNTSNILRTTNTTVSTSTVSGALQVAGGAGIAGNVYAGAVYTNGLFYANGSAFVSSVTIGGSSGQIQYNNGGSLAGSANLVWDNANGRLGIGNVSIPVSYPLTIIGNNPRATVKGTGAGLNVGYRLEATDSGSTSRSAGYYFVPVTGSNQSYLGLSANDSSYQLVARADGNVGIGTTNPSQRLEVAGTGLATTDWRAPIFYDSDDTAYYVNPAGTSILNNARANNFHDSTGTYNINLGSPSEGRGLVAGYSGGWYAGIGYNVRHSGSSGVMYAPSADTALYLNFGNTNRFNFWFNNSGAAGRSISWTELGFLDNSGIMQVTGSHRAPIFYDSNDTNYYLDPASTSRLNAISINSIVGNTTNYSVYNSSSTLLATPTGINYSSAFMHFTGANSIAPYSMYRTGGDWPVPYGIGFSTGGESSGIFQQYASNGSSLGPMVFYTGNDGSGSFSWKRHTWESTTYIGSGSNHLATGLMDLDWNQNLYVYGSARAPIFYDSNDTGYYCDPASTSLFNLGYFASGAYTALDYLDAPGTPGTYVWVRAPLGQFNAGGDTVRFSVARSIFDNGSSPYGGPSAEFTVHSREWHGGQECCTVYYSEHGSGSGTGGLYIAQAGPRDLAGGGYWFYMKLEGGIRYRIYKQPGSGYMGSFSSTTDPGSVPTINSLWGLNLLGNAGTLYAASTGESIRAAGNIVAYYSDERLKTKLGNIANALKKVNQLNGFYYQANELAQSLGYKSTLEVGVSAQEVELVLPEIVKPAPIDEKYLTIHYERLIPLLIEAIKELSAKVDSLERKLQ